MLTLGSKHWPDYLTRSANSLGFDQLQRKDKDLCYSCNYYSLYIVHLIIEWVHLYTTVYQDQKVHICAHVLLI